MTRALGARQRLASTVLVGGLFAAAAAAGAYWVSPYVAPVLFAGLLKYAIGIVGVVWLFSLSVYNKLSDATDLPGLDFRQHRNLELEVRGRLQWFWMRALFLALVALALYAPSILIDAKMAIPDWVFSLSCAALALALFSLRRLWRELEEIRELKSWIKETERREKERAESIERMKGADAGAWEADPRLDGFRERETRSH